MMKSTIVMIIIMIITMIKIMIITMIKIINHYIQVESQVP